jgi:hypothetical protein
MRIATLPHPAVAEARRVVADPGFCARPARQTRRPANPAPFYPGGDAA